MNHLDHPSRRKPRPRRLGHGILVLCLGLALPATLSRADDGGGGRRKPVRPLISIDNEGPLVVIRDARTVPGGDQDRMAAPPDHLWLPWRRVIRLDLILPIHSLPDRGRHRR